MRITQQSNSCEGVKPDGDECKARRVAGSSYCFFHDPEKRAERESAQRAGGLKNKVAVLSSTTPDARLLDAKDVVKLLAETINQVRRGEVDPKVANAVGYLGGLLMKAIHETEIESRLATLEAAHKRQPATLPEFNLAKDKEEFNLDDDREHSDQAGTNGDN
jgi:hypothetical protein